MIDHLVYATSDLDRGIVEIENLTGVRATLGGKHRGFGTHNALVALGSAVYLEIISPDPDRPDPLSPRIFGLDQIETSRLAAWCVRKPQLERFRTDAVRKGVPLGEVTSGGRRRPDGVELTWRTTDPEIVAADGVVPFFIEWGIDSPHPARSAPGGATLLSLRGEHPDAASIRNTLSDLGVDLPVKQAARAALVATIGTARGPVELR
jgi:hypothetical protein